MNNFNFFSNLKKETRATMGNPSESLAVSLIRLKNNFDKEILLETSRLFAELLPYSILSNIINRLVNRKIDV